MLGFDIDGLGISGGVTERLHDQVGRKPEAGQILQLIAGHRPGCVLRANGGHHGFAIGARSYALDTTGPAHHFLTEGKALAGVDRLFRCAEELGLPQAQRLAGTPRQAAADNQVDSTAGTDFIENDVGFELVL